MRASPTREPAAGLGSERVATLETWLQDDLRPDLVMVFDVPVEIGLQRALARGKRDRIENEDVSFFERARSAYLERAQCFPDRYRVIDAAQDLEAVSSDVARVWDAWRQGQDR
jgi:dTMP kinase